jgi:hypothetical protein
MARSRGSRFAIRFLLACLVILNEAVRCILLVTVAVLSALGMLYLGVLGTVLTIAVSAGLGILLARTWSAESVGPSLGILRDGTAASASAVAIVALAGWAHAQPGAAVLGLLALPCGWAILWWRLSGRLLKLRSEARRGCSDRPVQAHELADLLGRLPTDVLLSEWQRSGSAIAAHPGLAAETALVGLRALVLDELEARDAKGFSAWQRAAGRRPCSPVPFLDDTD